MAAGLATLAEMTTERYDALEALTSELVAKLEALFADTGTAASVTSARVALQPPISRTRARPPSSTSHLLANGILFTARGMGSLSVPMTGAEVDAFVEAVRISL